MMKSLQRVCVGTMSGWVIIESQSQYISKEKEKKKKPPNRKEKLVNTCKWN